MKTTNKKTIELFVALYEARQAKKKIEILEDELKKQVKALMGDNLIMQAGNLAVSIKQRTRTDLDKDGLKVLLGDNLKKYEKVSHYDAIEVSRTKKTA